jgi:hypothetical protein
MIEILLMFNLTARERERERGGGGWRETAPRCQTVSYSAEHVEGEKEKNNETVPYEGIR